MNAMAARDLVRDCKDIIIDGKQLFLWDRFLEYCLLCVFLCVVRALCFGELELILYLVGSKRNPKYLEEGEHWYKVRRQMVSDNEMIVQQVSKGT